MHRYILVIFEVPAEVLCEAFHGRFAGIVGGVARGIGNALLGASDYYGTRRSVCTRFEGGNVCVEAIDDAEEIGGKNLMVTGVSAFSRTGRRAAKSPKRVGKKLNNFSGS